MFFPIQATMDALVTGAGGDLRLILGQLQMVRLRSRVLHYDEVRHLVRSRSS